MIMDTRKLKKARIRKNGSDCVITSLKSFKLILVKTKYKANAVIPIFKINLKIPQSFFPVIETICIIQDINAQKA